MPLLAAEAELGVLLQALGVWFAVVIAGGGVPPAPGGFGGGAIGVALELCLDGDVEEVCLAGGEVGGGFLAF